MKDNFSEEFFPAAVSDAEADLKDALAMVNRLIVDTVITKGLSNIDTIHIDLDMQEGTADLQVNNQPNNDNDSNN